MKTKAELDAIVAMVAPFNGPLVVPVVELVAEHRRLEVLLRSAVRVIQAYGEDERYTPNRVWDEMDALRNEGFDL